MVVHSIYWISTALLSLLYFASALMYVVKQREVESAQAELGFSSRPLVPFMVIIKVLAPIAILSRLIVPLSDLAYAGIFYHLILSGLAHLGVRKPKGALPAAVGLVLLIGSFTTQNVAREWPSPYAATTVQFQHIT